MQPLDKENVSCIVGRVEGKVKEEEEERKTHPLDPGPSVEL